MPHAYRIARFVVTNAEYARFLAANGPDGYDLARDWYPEKGRAYIANEGRRVPYLWSDPRFTNPLQAVVGVTWWEATAYCRWLTSVGHDQGWLPPEAELRLPTWLEWERAARHTDPRPFPWGDETPDPERANYDETGIGAPAPIGCFPRGVAACGAHDMAGNVSEWTATPYQQPEQVIPEKDFTPFQGVVISWSYYGSDSERIFCGARFRYYPGSRSYFRGFRMVWSRALGV
jgi:formylglycine-generating enzyme required for sulfatase activity